MFVKCPYCSYAKPDHELDNAKLARLTESDLPIEDRLLITRQLADAIPLAEYDGVKIHIGRKHKGTLNWPDIVTTPEEQAILKDGEVEYGTSRQ